MDRKPSISWRVLDGFGRSVRAACRYVTPRTTEELAAVFASARGEGQSIGFRGAGCSYGDAAINREGIVADTSRLARVLHWDPSTGVIDAEAGVTIEGLWRRTVQDGYWPAVVPGTMKPTLGGCLAMNVHGKNNFRAGPIGEHVIEIDLLTTTGELITCSREKNADIFVAAIGGMGLLGAITRLKLRLKRVHSGGLRVESRSARNLDEMFDLFEEGLPVNDYLVGWVDCFASGKSVGRGIVHVADYLGPGEDPGCEESLHVERQGLPPNIAFLPKNKIWRIMRFLTNDAGMRVVNAGKYHVSWREHRRTYFQSHVGFAFLLDYVPDWRLAYGPEGFIQYQVFVPHAEARACLRDVLVLSQKAGIRPYLGVMKRHRADGFLLSHALDGWSLAMDFRVTQRRRQQLVDLTHALTARVLAAGGKFYFAKDSVLDPAEVAKAYGTDRLQRFAALKRRLDPTCILSNDLWRRTIAPLSSCP
jgi:decaprenylphospho-beta-D-ribofuranose 2-oxidase